MESKVIYPGSTIGILGGGQLGRMIALEGKRMGYQIVCLDPTPGSPCGQVADEQIIASLDDLEAAFHLGRKSDIIIYEFESIDLNVVKTLEENFYLPQGSKILAIAQNRLAEKIELKRAGFPLVPFFEVENFTDLEKGIEVFDFPCVLKTATGGYDGKGQFVIDNKKDLEELRKLKFEGRQWVMEKRVNLIHELSVIVARNENGEVTTYPIGENIHRSNILHKTIIPSPNVSEETQIQATKIAIEMAHCFNLVGLLVVELFLTPEGLLVNEIAPRPHNSGHYTLDACYVSQFEQLIRAVCGLPLGVTELLTPVIMVNILGENFQAIMENIKYFSSNVKVHLYGKKGYPEAKRKIGHLTIKDFENSIQDKILIEKIF